MDFHNIEGNTVNIKTSVPFILKYYTFFDTDWSYFCIVDMWSESDPVNLSAKPGSSANNITNVNWGNWRMWSVMRFKRRQLLQYVPHFVRILTKVWSLKMRKILLACFSGHRKCAPELLSAVDRPPPKPPSWKLDWNDYFYKYTYIQ